MIHPTGAPQPQTPVSNSTPVSSASTINSNGPSNPRLTQPAPGFPQDLPFQISRSFMIDYMWHQHHQQQGNNSHNTTSNIVSTPTKPIQFSPYSALSWIKQPPSSFLFKPTGNSDDKPAFNHFSAFKPVINMRVDTAETTNAQSSVVGHNLQQLNQPQSPTSSTSSYNHTTASSNNGNQSDEGEVLTPIKPDHRKKYQRFGNQKESNYIDVEEDGDSNQMSIIDDSKRNGQATIDRFDNDLKEQMISDDENEVVDIETTEDEVRIHDLQPYKTSARYEHETDEEIQVIDDKNLDVENNNNHVVLEENERCIKSRIVKMSGGGSSPKGDTEGEEYQHKKSRKSPYNNNDWTLNLKKEVSGNFYSWD